MERCADMSHRASSPEPPCKAVWSVEVSLAARDRACTVFTTAAASVAGGIAPPGIVFGHHTSNLRWNRILRSPSGSRRPRPPNLYPFSYFLHYFLTGRDSGKGAMLTRGVGELGRGSHNRSRSGPGSISFRPPRRGDPHLLSFTVVIKTFGCPLRAFLGQPFHRLLETTDFSLQKAHLPPQVCAVLFILTVGRFRVLHDHLLVDRSDLRFITSRVVAAIGTVADGSGGCGHSGGLGVVVGIGDRPAPRAPLLPFIGSRQQRGVATVGGCGSAFCGPGNPALRPLAERVRTAEEEEHNNGSRPPAPRRVSPSPVAWTRPRA